LTDQHEIWNGCTGLALKIFNFYKSEMADGRHLEKFKSGHILATVRSIGTTFGILTHIGSPNQTSSFNFELLKIQDGRQPPC